MPHEVTDYDDIEFETEIAASNQKERMKGVNKYNLFMIITLVCFISLSGFQLLTIHQFYLQFNAMEGTVISPFVSIVEEHSPKSSTPCLYQTLEHAYSNTHFCNFTNTKSSHFCPENYTCSYNTEKSSTVPYVCISADCPSDCVLSVLQYPYYNGNETARIVTSSIPPASYYLPLSIFSICTVLVILLSILFCFPQIRNSKRSAVISFTMFFITSILLFSILLGDANLEFGYSNNGSEYYCYTGDLYSTMHSLNSIDSVPLLYLIFQSMVMGCFIFSGAFQVPFIVKILFNINE